MRVGKKTLSTSATVLAALLAMTACSSADVAPVAATAPIAPVAQTRLPAPTALVVDAAGEQLVARWEAVSGATGYEIFVNTAPAIPLEVGTTEFALPTLNPSDGAFVQVRATAAGQPGDAAMFTLEPSWPEPAKAESIAPPSPAPQAASVSAPEVSAPSTSAPQAPAAAVTVPSPVPSPAADPVPAPAPAATPAPAPVSTTTTKKGVLTVFYIWDADVVEEPTCASKDYTFVVHDGADAIVAAADLEEVNPTEVETTDYGSISWSCDHPYSLDVPLGSPTYRFVAEFQTLSGAKIWDRLVPAAKLGEDVDPHLSYCSGCSRP